MKKFASLLCILVLITIFNVACNNTKAANTTIDRDDINNEEGFMTNNNNCLQFT